jgi:hypothetical protein
MREECRLKLLKRIFESTRDEVIGEWKKLHNEIINYLYPLPHSPYIIRVIYSRRKRWAGV